MDYEFAKPDIIRKYGADQWVDEPGHPDYQDPPIFGRSFKNATWNRPWAGKRVGRDVIRDGKYHYEDLWCYVNRLKGCVDFNVRNAQKLDDLLRAKFEREEAESKNQARRENIFAGKRTRKGVKKTRKLRKTKRR